MLGPCPGSLTSAVVLAVPDLLLEEPGAVSLAVEGCDGSTSSSTLAVTGIGKAVTAAMYFGLGALGAWAFIMGMGQRW